MIKVTKLTEHSVTKEFNDAFTIASAKRFAPHLLEKVTAQMDVTPAIQNLSTKVEFSDECKDPTEAFKLALMYSGVVVEFLDPEDYQPKTFGAWIPN